MTPMDPKMVQSRFKKTFCGLISGTKVLHKPPLRNKVDTAMKYNCPK